MTNPKESFESLLRALHNEKGLQPKSRSKEHEELTLQYFLDHGRSTEDHVLWRECHMIEEMIAILNRKYWALNPHKKRQLQAEQLARESAFEIGVKYQQEVNEDGRTDKETDNSTTTIYPDTERKDLEIQAAENYLYAIWGITRKQATRKTSQYETTDQGKSQNNNPVLSWEEFKKRLKKDFHTESAITKAAERCIKLHYGKQKDPWLMGQCATGYQIVTPEIRRGKECPTPAFCKYQEISQDKTLDAQ